MTLKIECHFFRYKTEVYVCWCRVLLTRRRRKLPSVFREPLAGSSLIFTLSLIDVLFYESAWKPFRSSNRLPHIPKRPDLPCQKSTTRQMFPPSKVPATAEYAGLTENNNRIPKNSPASLGAKAATHPGSTIITKTEANSQIHHFLFIYNHFFLSRCEVQKMLQRSASGATIL